MVKSVKKLALLVVGLISSVLATAQDNTETTANLMRSNGKIYVVVAVCLTILIGLFIYVFVLDRKITRLEKNGE